jgi:phthalate 4,5-cis-dihydrodiol dehydrogenase
LARPTEGAYSALLSFANGAFASLIYSGYAHFDSDEFCGWVSELGRAKDARAYGEARRALAAADGAAEGAAKNARNYGGSAYAPPQEAPWHEHFGLLIVSCERADLRPTPMGLTIYGDAIRDFEAFAKPAVPRSEVIDELCDAVFSGKRPAHDGEWGRATLEVCVAMLRSAREGVEVALTS